MPDTMKSKLSEALKLKMTSKPLDKITIKEITDMCEVNRQTFYYHFADIYDLLKWTYDNEIICLLKKQSTIPTWQESLLLLLEYINDNKQLCLCTLNSIGHRHVKRFFSEDAYNIVKSYITSLKTDISAPKDFTDFEVHFYTLALGSIAESWVLGEIDKTPAELVTYIDALLSHKYRK